jgi:hypothetical protein
MDKKEIEIIECKGKIKKGRIHDEEMEAGKDTDRIKAIQKF